MRILSRTDSLTGSHWGHSSHTQLNKKFGQTTFTVIFREDPLSVTSSAGVNNLHQDPKFKPPISISQCTDVFLVFFGCLPRQISKWGPAPAQILPYHQEITSVTRWCGIFTHTINNSVSSKSPGMFPGKNQSLSFGVGRYSVTMSKVLPPKPPNHPFCVRFCFQYYKSDCCNQNPRTFKHICMNCRGSQPKSKCTWSCQSPGAFSPTCQLHSR